MTSAGTTSAQARPQTLAPQPNAGMDASSAQIIVNYDDPIDPSGSSLTILDATGNAAQGFYTFVVGSGLVGIVNGVAQSQAPGGGADGGADRHGRRGRLQPAARRSEQHQWRGARAHPPSRPDLVRRTNIFNDAQASFDFSIDSATGSPAFSQS